MRFEHLMVLQVAAVVVACGVPPAAAQVAPAAGNTTQADTPSIKVGVTFFGDYTMVQQPKVIDADGNAVTGNAFNVGRAYLNVTGSVSRVIGFRVTPDIVRESGAGSSLAGSYTFRLKYAYAQVNLDDWMPRGSWLRFGMQQTPWVDFMETVYRYRFQGNVFEDREGFLSSSDAGASVRFALPAERGDVHAGVYNGESFTRAETNDQKGFMVRGSLRPLPAHRVLHGLRVTGFYDRDAYVRDADRRRAIGAVTFEHAYLNASFDYMAAADRTSAAKRSVDARGLSLWATPRMRNGWEGLLRYDRLEPDDDAPGTRKRTIAGIAYWFPHQGAVSAAVLADIERVNNDGFVPRRANERRFAVHALVNF